MTSRFTYRPIVIEDQILHFGSSFLYQETDDANTIRLRGKPAVSLPRTPAVLSVSLSDDESFVANGFEAAWFRGPLSIQAEYLRANPGGYGGAVADGYYLQFMFFTSDAKRNYVIERGTFGRPKLLESHPGTREFGLRYDQFDLEGFDTGMTESWSLAATRYFNIHLKLAFLLCRRDCNGSSSESCYK